MGLNCIVPHHGGNGAQNALYAVIHHLEEGGLRVYHFLVYLLLLQDHLDLLPCLVGQGQL